MNGNGCNENVLMPTLLGRLLSRPRQGQGGSSNGKVGWQLQTSFFLSLYITNNTFLPKRDTELSQIANKKSTTFKQGAEGRDPL